MHDKVLADLLVHVGGVGVNDHAGVGLLLVGLLLQVSGYSAGASEQTGFAKATIVGILTVVPILFVLLGIFAAIRYPIDKHNASRIQEVVRQRRSGDFDKLDEEEQRLTRLQIKEIMDAKKKVGNHAE